VSISSGIFRLAKRVRAALCWRTSPLNLPRKVSLRRLSRRPRPEENEAERAAELETEAGSNAFVAY
jgi:hypothetical protein